MCKRELNRRRFNRNAMTLAYCVYSARLCDHCLRGRLIVIVGNWRVRIGKNATVVYAANEDGDLLLKTDRKERVQSSLFQKGVPPRQKEAIKITFSRESRKHPRLIH